MSQMAHKFDPTHPARVRHSRHRRRNPARRRRPRHRPRFGTLVRRKGGKRVALGYDGRLSSPELAAAWSRA